MSRYDGLIIPRSYNEYINKSDPLTLAQALQQNNVLSGAVAAGDNKAVKSSAVYEALTNYINKTDAATLQQALQLPGVLSGAVAAGDNKAVKSSAVYEALKNSKTASHNIPRIIPKNITSYVTDGTLWKRLNGTNGYALFEDIYVGDYIKMSRAISAYERTGQYQKTGSQYVTIAGIDTMWGNGNDNVISKHHLVMVPGQGFGGTQHFGRARMNAANDTTGGYKASEMNAETLGSVVSTGSTAATASINQQLYAEFGVHLQTTKEMVSNTLNASGINRFGGGSNLGCSSNWEWISAQAVLMSEVEVYGATVWSSSGFDTGNANRQLPLFAFSKQAQNNHSIYYWIKDVASAAYFCLASDNGRSDYFLASGAHCYVRPRFILAA